MLRGAKATAAEVSDDVVRLFAAVGTHRAIAAEVAARFGGVADALSVSASSEVRPELPPDLIQDLGRIPSAFAGHRGTAATPGTP